MKKILILAALINMTVFVVNAQKINRPIIEFEWNVYDYDTIMQNNNGMCSFRFKNTGDAPLIISSTSASCGCTEPEFDSKPVMPGEVGEIKVKYNTSLVGAFRKTIVVKSNAANQGTSILTIKGYVKKKE